MEGGGAFKEGGAIMGTRVAKLGGGVAVGRGEVTTENTVETRGGWGGGVVFQHDVMQGGNMGEGAGASGRRKGLWEWLGEGICG